MSCLTFNPFGSSLSVWSLRLWLDPLSVFLRNASVSRVRRNNHGCRGRDILVGSVGQRVGPNVVGCIAGPLAPNHGRWNERCQQRHLSAGRRLPHAFARFFLCSDWSSRGRFLCSAHQPLIHAPTPPVRGRLLFQNTPFPQAGRSCVYLAKPHM